jgi:carboxypeptidase family protein/TonB-dependent receptor-like protein
MKKNFIRLVLLFSALFVFTSVALGQNTGTISGTVQDQSGAVVAGANVKAQNPATNFSRETTSATNGFYRFDQLPVGTYTISVEAAGFKKSVSQGVALSVNDALTLDLKLEVGQVSEIVTVSEAPSAVNTETSVLGKTVDNRTLNDLPILSGAGGRNPLALAPLQAGVMPAGQVGPFSVNGQRAQSNNFLLDGGDSNDLAINVPDAVSGFSPDALQEFRILTNTFAADNGRNSGAVVALITKSGTNEYHGNLFEFFRNRALNATPFFNNAAPTFVGLRKPQFNVNEFGGTIGGPLHLPRFGEGGPAIINGKDRTFFFFSYLGFRRRQGVSQTATVPTQAQRNVINAVGTPEAKALLALIPAANSGSTLFSSASNSFDRDQFSIRGDHRFSESNSMFITFFNEDQVFTDPFAFGGSTIPGFGTSGDLRFTNVVVSDFHTFSARSVNEFRFSWHQRDTLSVVPLNRTSPADLGIEGLVPDDGAAAGPPRVDITGFSTFGNTIQGPQGRDDNTFQFVDNFSHNRGNHHFKWGGEYRNYFQNQTFDFINNGLYVFTGDMGAIFGLPNIPGLNGALSDFARGLPIQYIQNSAGTPRYETQSYSLFLMDDWKVRPNLTFNMGLRYELDKPLVDSQDRINTFRPGQQSTVFPTAPRSMVFPGDAGITRSTYQTDKNNFGPRFGFAWDVLNNGRMSLRAGYGLYYDTVISETTLQFLTAPPFAIQPFSVCTTIDSPLQNPVFGGICSPSIAQPFPFTPAQPGDPFDFTSIGTIGMTINDPDFKTPYSHQYNMGIQWEFMRNYLLEVGYVGTSGVNLLTRREINPSLITPTGVNNAGNADPRRIFNQNNPLNAAFGGAVFSNITNQETSAHSNYNSLQATLSHRFSDGFYFQNAYTWSHCIDNSSGLRSNTRFNNPSADRGNCDQDIRHRNVLSYIYELPFYKDQKGFAGKILGGWQMSGVTTLQTGTPFNITEPTDRSLSGAGSDRPDFTGTEVVFHDPRNTDSSLGGPNRSFNGTGGGSATAATNPFFRRVGSSVYFCAAGCGTNPVDTSAGRFGSLGRNVFHGPGDILFDFTMMKRTKIGEGKILEFRSEFFNVFNHANFGNPNGSIGSVNFGRITTTRDPRLIQFALKFHF